MEELQNDVQQSTRETIKQKLRQCFDGKIVRKDLTKKIKEGANVPVYVLEFLLGQYCSSDDPEVIAEGVQTVKRILADNFVRPDEAQKVLSMLKTGAALRSLITSPPEWISKRTGMQPSSPIWALRIS